MNVGATYGCGRYAQQRIERTDIGDRLFVKHDSTCLMKTAAFIFDIRASGWLTANGGVPSNAHHSDLPRVLGRRTQYLQSREVELIWINVIRTLAGHLSGDQTMDGTMLRTVSVLSASLLAALSIAFPALAEPSVPTSFSSWPMNSATRSLVIAEAR
jgi:hypothetical protein